MMLGFELGEIISLKVYIELGLGLELRVLTLSLCIRMKGETHSK